MEQIGTGRIVLSHLSRGALWPTKCSDRAIKCRLSCYTSELAPLLRRARRHRRGGSQVPPITTGDGGAFKFVQGVPPPSRTSSSILRPSWSRWKCQEDFLSAKDRVRRLSDKTRRFVFSRRTDETDSIADDFEARARERARGGAAHSLKK